MLCPRFESVKGLGTSLGQSFSLGRYRETSRVTGKTQDGGVGVERQSGMVLIVWAFSWFSGIFGYVEEALFFKALSCDRVGDYWPSVVRRMENIRDSVYIGWMSQTSKWRKGVR